MTYGAVAPRKSGQPLAVKIKEEDVAVVERRSDDVGGRHGQLVDGTLAANGGQRWTHVAQVPHLGRPVVRARHHFVLAGERHARHGPVGNPKMVLVKVPVQLNDTTGLDWLDRTILLLWFHRFIGFWSSLRIVLVRVINSLWMALEHWDGVDGITEVPQPERGVFRGSNDQSLKGVRGCVCQLLVVSYSVLIDQFYPFSLKSISHFRNPKELHSTSH